MSELTYHKRIKKQFNSLSEKERYQKKRERRASAEKPEQRVNVSWIKQMKLKMAMNPKDYRDYLQRTTKKPEKKELPKVKTEVLAPPKFDKMILKARSIFNKSFGGRK